VNGLFGFDGGPLMAKIEALDLHRLIELAEDSLCHMREEHNAAPLDADNDLIVRSRMAFGEKPSERFQLAREPWKDLSRIDIAKNDREV